jgi:hypothetical protein
MSDYIDTTFEFEGNTYPLRILTGSVIDTNARSDTHVTGGGSYVSGNRTHVSEVRSHVEITQNLWLQCASGMERHLEFKTDFPVRAGHVLQIAFLVGYADENTAWVSFDNITTGQGWTATHPFLNAKTTGQNLISLLPYYSSAAYFYLVKCSYVPFFISLLLILMASQTGYDYDYSDYLLGMTQFFLPLFAVTAFLGFFVRSRKRMSEPFKNAAIAKFNGLTTQRDEAVEQLKASLSEAKQNEAIAPVRSYRSGSSTISEG